MVYLKYCITSVVLRKMYRVQFFRVYLYIRNLKKGHIIEKVLAMKEQEWVNSIVGKIQKGLNQQASNIIVEAGKELPYAHEVLSYVNQEPKEVKRSPYKTDLLIYEQLTNQTWKPRLIIEVKINSISTHSAITYSQKAYTHKAVHPYLRYGILLGNRKDLPGRLFRHGAYFDFMLSWQTYDPSKDEFKALINLILDEVETSRNLEEIIFNSRRRNRKRYTFLHRPLELK